MQLPSAPPERDVLAEEKDRFNEKVMKIFTTTKGKINGLGVALAALKKQLAGIDNADSRLSFYKNSVLPAEVKYDMELKIKECQNNFLQSQISSLDEVETINGLKELDSLILTEVNTCRQLYEGRVGQLIADRKALIELGGDLAGEFEEEASEAMRSKQLNRGVRGLPDFIEEQEEDLTPQEIESRKYRAARKASPQLARERRQSPTIMGDIKRYGLGRYRGLEDDYEIPQI
jgi:hypothetical protein